MIPAHLTSNAARNDGSTFDSLDRRRRQPVDDNPTPTETAFAFWFEQLNSARPSAAEPSHSSDSRFPNMAINHEPVPASELSFDTHAEPLTPTSFGEVPDRFTISGDSTNGDPSDPPTSSTEARIGDLSTMTRRDVSSITPLTHTIKTERPLPAFDSTQRHDALQIAESGELSAEAVSQGSQPREDLELAAVAETNSPHSVSRGPLSERVVQQVVEETMSRMAVHRTPGEQKFTVRLDPPELGRVRVTLNRSRGELRLRVHATNETTRLLLSQNTDAILDSLSTTDHSIHFSMDTDSEQSSKSRNNWMSESSSRRDIPHDTTFSGGSTLASPRDANNLPSFRA